MLLTKNCKTSKIYIVCFLAAQSFITLLFCSGASPLIKQFFSDTGFYIYYGRWIQSGGLPFVNSPDNVCKVI